MWLQRKDEASYESYKEKKNQGEKVERIAKVNADERWCRKITESFNDIKKNLWKGLQNYGRKHLEMKKGCIQMMVQCRLKRKHGRRDELNIFKDC